MLSWLTRVFGGEAGSDAGAQGEQAAADWLVRHRRFTVVVRNWRDPRDRRQEIDLVCRDREVLVFVEVKARAPGALVPGYYAVDRRKKRALRRAFYAYLSHLRPKPKSFRFDIVEVCNAGTNRTATVLHFENIPLFPKHYHG